MRIIFAPDNRAVADELARVCEPGGRLGFSAWRKDAGFTPVTRRYSPPLQSGQGDPVDWASGPFRARAAALEPERREQFHREFVDLLESHSEGGEIELPAPYLVALGTRRSVSM